MKPQQMVAEFCAEAGVSCFDAAPVFRSKDVPSRSFFVDDMDPWHLSEYGHEVVHEIITGIISGQLPISGGQQPPIRGSS